MDISRLVMTATDGNLVHLETVEGSELQGLLKGFAGQGSESLKFKGLGFGFAVLGFVSVLSTGAGR